MDIESLFQALLKLPCHIYWQDNNQTILGCNKQFTQFLGYESESDIIGRLAANIFKNSNIEILKSNDFQTSNYVTYRLSDGSRCTFDIFSIEVNDSKGNKVGKITVALDVTSKQNQIDFLKHIFNEMPGNVWWKSKEGILLGCNEHMAKALGFNSVEDVIGRNNYTILDANLPESKKQELSKQIYQNDERVIFGGNIFRGEEQILQENKNKVFLSIKKPLKDLNGELLGLVGISQDITDIKNEKEALRRIIAILPGHVWWKDKDSNILGCNDLMAQRLGCENAKGLVGRSALELISNKLPQGEREKAAAETMRIDKYVMDSGEAFKGEEFGEVDGKMITFYSHKMPIRDLDGNITGTIGVAQDITELKETQRKLEKANEVKSEFIANMSHDLRTPITGMLGETEFIENHVDDKEVQESARFLREATQQLLRLSNDILEYVTLESEHFDEPITVFNPIEVVEHVFTLMRVSSRHKSLDFDLEIDPQVPEAVRGYGQYFERIVSNLVANAIKFTHHGSVKVSLGVEEQKSDEVILRLSVQDTGVGIPADKYEEIFDQFYKLSSSYQGLYKGSGLGLYSVKQYVGQMQGHIDVDSIVGKGTTFSVTLPFDKAVAAQTVQIDFSRSAPLQPITDSHETQSAEVTVLNTSINKTYKVLVVEDSPLPARAVMRLLHDHHCEVKLVTNGEDAVKEAIKKRYDLILMDIGLPGMDGIEATKQIRALPENGGVPIVALTGHARGQRKADCLGAGMQEVYAKPLSRHQLNHIFDSYVQPSKPQAQYSVQGSIDKFTLDVAATMEKYQMVDQSQLKDMLEETMLFIPKELAELKNAVEQQNMPLICSLIQELKGGLSYLVAPECNDLTVTWDGIVHQEVLKPQTMQVMLEQLDNALNALLDAIRQIVADLK